MTPSRRLSAPWDGVTPWHRKTLWGTLGWLSVEGPAAGTTWEAHLSDRQALTTDVAVIGPLADHRDYRREWSGELVARRALSSGVTAMARAIYQDRAQRYGEGIGPGAFAGIDRLRQIELAWRASPAATCRIGVLHDRISIARRGVAAEYGYGSRKESRGYLGLALRFGQVSVQGIEGIELDHEPYEVWFVHDKGFIQLQTTF
jgi:hypothetical protein